MALLLNISVANYSLKFRYEKTRKVGGWPCPPYFNDGYTINSFVNIDRPKGHLLAVSVYGFKKAIL